jgi:hypothetical protein
MEGDIVADFGGYFLRGHSLSFQSETRDANRSGLVQVLQGLSGSLFKDCDGFFGRKESRCAFAELPYEHSHPLGMKAALTKPDYPVVC